MSEGLRRSSREGRNQIDLFGNFHGGNNDGTEQSRQGQPRRDQPRRGRRLERDPVADGRGEGKFHG